MGLRLDEPASMGFGSDDDVDFGCLESVDRDLV
jgi:hypothetical protein